MSNKKPTYQDLEKQISELKSEKRLKQSEDRFNALLKASEDMITIHKPNGKYIYYNGPTCYAITTKDIVGKMPNDLFDKEVSSTLLSAFARVEQTGVSETLEVLLDWLGEKRWFSEYIYPIKNAEGKIIELVKVCRDIHQRKIAELELEEQNKNKEKQAKELAFSKQKIQTTLELLEKRKYSMDEASKIAKIGYWEHDLITNKVIWSDYVHYIFGSNPKNGIPPQKLIVEGFDKESLEKFEKVTLDILSKGIPYDIELKWTNEKKEEIWIRNLAQPIFNKQNRIVGKRGVMQNITESKNAQNESELSKQKIHNTLKLLEKSEYSNNEASKMVKIGYFEDDFLTETREWSESLYYIFGFDLIDEIPSRKEITDLFDNESKIKIEQSILKLDSEGTTFDIEAKMINLRKEEVWLRAVVQPVYNKQNKIVGRRGIMQDISVSKNSQLQLELSKQKIQTTLELVKENEYSLKEAGRMAKIGYWRFDNLIDTLFWSDAIYQIYGADPKLGVPTIEAILKMYTKESQKLILESLDDLTKKGTPYDIELEFINFKNEKGWIRNIGEPIYNKKNEIIGRRGVSQDITQKKINETNLDKKNKKLYELNNALNQAQKLSNVGSWQWNMTTDTAEWSDEMYNIYGVTKESFYPSNENVLKTVLQEDLYKVEQGVASLLVDKIFVPFEFRIVRPSGEIRHLYIMALEKNSQESVFGVTKDITEQKLIEQENLSIKDNYIRLFDNASVSIWNEDLSLIFDEVNELKKLGITNVTLYLEQYPEVLFLMLEKLKVNKVNKATLKLFKAKSNEEFLNNITDTFGDGADKVFVKLIESIWNKEKSFTSEVNYKNLEGNQFAAIVSIPIPSTKLEQKTVPVSIQSIQSIKEAELKNKESLNRLNEAQEIAHIGSWLFNLSNKETEWSDETYSIWGFDKEKPAPSLETFLNRIHTDDKDLFNKAAELVYNEGTPYDIEFRVCLPNNIQKTIRSICKPVFDNNGKVVSLKGTNQDITEQKRIRNKIEKAEEMYRLLTDNSNDLICLQESDSTFKYISPSIKNLLGFEQSTFLGKKVFSIVHPDDIQSLKDKMGAKVFDNKVVEAYSFRVRHKEGHYVWVEFLSSPVYKDNKINYYVTSSRDITKSVLAQQEIQEYQTSLQKMTTEMTLIEEKHKKEIASNIHDHLSQSLVISKMKINELKKNPQLKIIDEDLKFIEKHISEVLENSRKITYELSPPVLYQLGIIDALNWLLEDVEATHKIKCSVNSNVSTINLSDIKSILVYRSIQELIKNTLKHANASLIILDIDKNNLGVNILFNDNGDGFNTSILNNFKNQSGSGFGLFAVQERIRNMQGKFNITSKINKGTSVNIFIPLSI